MKPKTTEDVLANSSLESSWTVVSHFKDSLPTLTRIYGCPKILDGEYVWSWFYRIATAKTWTPNHVAIFLCGSYAFDIVDSIAQAPRALDTMARESLNNPAVVKATFIHSALVLRFGRIFAPILRGRYGDTYRYCPHCFETDEVPHIRLPWMISWAVCCLKHWVALVGGCPHCGERIRLRGKDRILLPKAVRHEAMRYCSNCGGRLGHTHGTPAPPEIRAKLSLYQRIGYRAATTGYGLEIVNGHYDVIGWFHRMFPYKARRLPNEAAEQDRNTYFTFFGVDWSAQLDDEQFQLFCSWLHSSL